ncbi:acyltransferase [Tropicimonas marinistellae]|uniref:acyltransferase n=1 Tax=Tropicimonas marinistellae TaxID=1739787 RepID=UPI0008356578|nr:acyltransferase [Tropicimonas marinistellae]
MFVILGAIGGAIWGGYLARKRGGTWADVAQYAAGFAIALSLLGFFVTIFIERVITGVF